MRLGIRGLDSGTERMLPFARALLARMAVGQIREVEVDGVTIRAQRLGEDHGWVMLEGGAPPAVLVRWISPEVFAWHDEDAGVATTAPVPYTAGGTHSTAQSSSNARTLVCVRTGPTKAVIFRDGVEAGTVTQPAGTVVGPAWLPIAISDDGSRVVFAFAMQEAGVMGVIADVLRPVFKVVDVIDPVLPATTPSISEQTYTPSWDAPSGVTTDFTYTPDWTYAMSPSLDAIYIGRVKIHGTQVFVPSNIITRTYTVRGILANLTTLGETTIYDETFTPFVTDAGVATGQAPQLRGARCADESESSRATVLVIQTLEADGSGGATTDSTLDYARGASRTTFRTLSNANLYHERGWTRIIPSAAALTYQNLERVAISTSGVFGTAVRDATTGLYSAYHVGLSGATMVWEDEAGETFAGGPTADAARAVYTKAGTPAQAKIVDAAGTFTLDISATGLVSTYLIAGPRNDDKLYIPTVGTKHVHYTVDDVDSVPTTITRVESAAEYSAEPPADPPGLSSVAAIHYLRYLERNAAVDTP